MSRQLYDDLISYKGNHIFDDVLSKHITDIRGYLTQCEVLKSYDPNLTLHMRALENKTANHKNSNFFSNIWTGLKTEIKEAKSINCYGQTKRNSLIDCLQFLFALSVCNDYLLILLNNNKLTVKEYTDFFSSIGMKVSYTNADFYNPFYHEIVKVISEQKASDERIAISCELYPMVMFGHLQFSRAGVYIYAHPHVDKELAEKSCLYFANRRDNRECQDLSHGWGHNSQWRTSFIRNYDTEKYWKINVDAQIDLNDTNAFGDNIKDFEYPFSFTIEQAKELLLNRHFIYPNNIPQELMSDFFPYDWRMDVPK